MALVVGAATFVACGADQPPPAIVQGSEARLAGFVDEVRQVEFQAEFVADHLAASCMESKGFDYWPRPVPAGGLPEGDFANLEFHSSDEFWAVVDQSGGEESAPDGWAESHRRNVAYQENLDAEGRAAYHSTLIGDIFSRDALMVETSSGGIQMSSNGCLAEARSQLFDGQDGVVLMVKLRSELEDTLFELGDLVSGSSEYVAGSEELESCIRRYGFDYEGVQMRVSSFINTDNGVEGTEAIFACVDELDTERRLQLLEDRAAYEILDSPEFEALIVQWEENRDKYLAELQQAEAELLSG